MHPAPGCRSSSRAAHRATSACCPPTAERLAYWLGGTPAEKPEPTAHASPATLRHRRRSADVLLPRRRRTTSCRSAVRSGWSSELKAGRRARSSSTRSPTPATCGAVVDRAARSTGRGVRRTDILKRSIATAPIGKCTEGESDHGRMTPELAARAAGPRGVRRAGALLPVARPSGSARMCRCRKCCYRSARKCSPRPSCRWRSTFCWPSCGTRASSARRWRGWRTTSRRFRRS